ncbi:hypothetical protein BU17DRAFT_90437 [Hysterangium stoloniferum]|nr:hypothetical protein BU17DRAFT_90437 [Hysterangium stoloniferum]
MSAPSSPLLLAHPGNPRRLSCRRRGSVTAADPWGTLPETERGVASTLHILKAPSNVAQELDDKAHRRKSLRDHIRAPSGNGNPTRISFAGSAFARPSSPVRNERGGTSPSRRSSFASHTRPDSTLTPMQVYELAQQCTHPQSQPSTPSGNTLLSPANFTPLPEMHHLPFIDRPSEIQELLSTPGTRKLFLLLAQTFPNGDTPGEVSDPTSWSYAQLEHWLTTTTRDEADDITWVQQAKMCIAGRSELIWERVKAALGVPPDLDGEYEDIVGPENPDGEDTSALDVDDTFEDAWVEAIVASPARSPSVCRSPVNSYFGRESPSLIRQLASRMEDISEDAPESDNGGPASPAVHGLRIVNYPVPPTARRFSSPSTPASDSFSPSHLPYNAVAERGPGNPLFPSTFANLALGPTLRANNPSLRSPSLPPDSAYPLSSGSSRIRRQTRSWAEGWNPQNCEYAVSAASGSSVGRGVVVD